MKKIYLTSIFVLSISIFLMGCSIEKENKKEDFGLEKVQKIEILSVENPESVLSIIDNKDDRTDFVNKLKIEKWSNEDIPSNAAKSRIYKMYQEDTIKFGEDNTNEKELKQIATITTYKDSPYIKFQTRNLNLSFKVPKEVAEYLSSKGK
ncbi:hypothetical protein [Bacillus cereus group sp. BfR-BA-01380]|uniref:hypothetical protein n=1 Tax=Bacillus cereus group sp. BfR-BA-01380 TaxID=2920324 RepID=UPI001F58F3D3|nr:hypothetical protein [Bacillus cereus group sp. BfR-BA-01380]